MRNEDFRSIIKVVAVVFISLFVITLMASFFGFGYGMMGGMMMMGGFGMLIPIAVIVLIIYFITKNNDNTDEDDFLKGKDPALNDLDRRYARGEISRKSYLLIKDDIMKSGK